MKIAVTYENGQIFQHFGHTEQFKIYEGSRRKRDSHGSGGDRRQRPWGIGGILDAAGVDTLICGGIGGGAKDCTGQCGHQSLWRRQRRGGCSGSGAFVRKNLDYDPDVHCSHHDHVQNEGGHSCGGHGGQNIYGFMESMRMLSYKNRWKFG